MVQASESMGQGPKGRILFVEDDLDTRDLVLLLLRDAGYETNIASGITEGLRLVKNKDFDLILLDWFFGDGTGVELCELIRAQDSETPIFFYTGVAYQTELNKAIKAGAQGCFVKPVDCTELLRAISLQLSDENAHREENRW
jgi:DNA-binding response OmpR family regulator